MLNIRVLVLLLKKYDFHGSYTFSIQKSSQSLPFDISGVYVIKLIQGLTEIGTTLIIFKRLSLISKLIFNFIS